MIDILTSLTIHWFDLFNQLFYLYIFKINFEYFDIVMYISANKVNITHLYTPQQGSTSPSTAGQEEAFGQPSRPQLKENSLMKAQASTQRKLSGGGPVCKDCWLVGFYRRDDNPSISPKASLPLPWQIGVSFRSQSSFLFLKNTMYKKKTQKLLRSDKQNKINTWSPLRTFGYYKDLAFPYKIFNHVAITRQTN